jgi:ATP-dependent DNA helicase DinG
VVRCTVMTLPDFRGYFPFPTIREEQRIAIEFALDAFLLQGKKFVILELGTGVGKSAIGVCLARYLAEHGGVTTAKLTDKSGTELEEETSGAYVLTTQKILQAQYMDDFGPSSGRNLMRSLKSANNYGCRFYEDQTCAESRRLLKQLGKQLEGTEFHKCCRGSCPYTLDKEEFLEFPIGITNFSYFLAETMYAKQLTPRSLLVIDECHNIESELGKFIEVSFSERYARQLGCKVPKLDTVESVFEWIKGPYKKAVLKAIGDVQKKLSANFAAGGAEGLSELSKSHERLDKHICKVNRFIEVYDPNNWVMNPVKTPFGEAKGGRKFEFKPVDVSAYGHDHLYRFGSRVVMMSATVVDKDTFCKSIGVNASDAAFLHIASPFPVANRPIHYLGVGSMSRDNIEATLPTLAATVKDLLELHKAEKGIVHCVNYRIAKYLVDTIKSPRLLLHDAENREEMIDFHLASKDPTVLISPSMTEGVDLADDASRFQILCKVPFPYLGDKVIQLRKTRNPNWYACQTARSVIQALGRSVRNDQDHASSYILDSDWDRFYRTNHRMFPSEFSAALT